MVGGRRRSQWSSGESVGVKVGVCGFPIWISDVVSQNSPSVGLWDLCFFVWGSLEIPAHDGRQGRVFFIE